MFRLCCMLVPALYFLFDIRVVHASISDAVAHFAPMVIAQIAVTTWLGGGRMLPLISRLRIFGLFLVHERTSKQSTQRAVDPK